MDRIASPASFRRPPSRIAAASASRRLRRAAAAVLVLAWSVTPTVDAHPNETAAPVESLTTGLGEEIDRHVARVREATAAFRSLDEAVAAGYARHVRSCLANPPHGAMGYHHQNTALLDDRIELERPEILVYERLPDGEYRLNGVEYIVPFSVWPADAAEPPRVMGQDLKPAPGLRLWYLHVWIWLENPSGLFADWNPRVEC